MSKKASAFLTLYRMGRVSKAALQKAVNDGMLTEEEYSLIVGEQMEPLTDPEVSI